MWKIVFAVQYQPVVGLACWSALPFADRLIHTVERSLHGIEYDSFLLRTYQESGWLL